MTYEVYDVLIINGYCFEQHNLKVVNIASQNSFTSVNWKKVYTINSFLNTESINKIWHIIKFEKQFIIELITLKKN